ncbi:MAG: ATPase, T2SS/T4P/T4SS family [Planctomycetota bacterium]|nr:ATPase, T2SS/T4P/T4SS family [Planctomycetota bacterium]
MVRVSRQIKRLLTEEGLISDEQWEEARKAGHDVVETLIANGIVEESSLLEVLGRSSGIAPVELSEVSPDPPAVAALGEAACKEKGVLPISKNGDVLTVAVSDPFDVILFDDLKRLTGCHIRPVLAPGPVLTSAIEAQFDNGAKQVADMMDEVRTDEVHIQEDSDKIDDVEKSVGDDDEAPAVKLANLVLLRALKEKASDIHIEPGEKHVVVRLRIDGRMREIMSPPKSILPALTSRLKILSKLDISERNVPQDGKFQIRFEGRTIDFRLSVLPVVGGEKSVIRILDTGSLALKLETMGYEEKSLQDITNAIESPYGMLLVTGPTGSGKSTTLYSCVQAVATPAVNVTTVEDPVEYRMDGINQVPVNPKRGMTFAGALRSILRQDPDIVLVGEVRDKETADIAVKAALTGHLVLTTLHTNDAASTITRLIDMGIDPFMVSSSVLCICAQRLARRLCKVCRVPVENPPHDHLIELGFIESDLTDELQLYTANQPGCRQCSGGYRGRFALLETMPMSQRLRRMVVEGRSSDDLKEQSLAEGMLTLRRVGILNAIKGVTSVEEVLRVTLSH